jgi:FkbM family methyltransferase
LIENTKARVNLNTWDWIMIRITRLFLLKIIRKYFSEKEFNRGELEILSSLLRVNKINSVYSKKVGLNIPVDNVIFPRVLSAQYNEGKLPEEFKNNIFHGCTFVDIGANVGIAASDIINIIEPSNCYLYEPDPFCFTLLEGNVIRPVFNQVSISIKNIGIGPEKGQMELFVDNQNSANNSLLRSSIPTKDRFGDVCSVEVADVRSESLDWISNGSQIFYMSDIQGMDEVIFSLIPSNVLDFILGGVIEIFSIEGKEFSQAEFLNKMSVFSKYWIRRNDSCKRIEYERLLELLHTSWHNNNRGTYDVIFSR